MGVGGFSFGNRSTHESATKTEYTATTPKATNSIVTTKREEVKERTFNPVKGKGSTWGTKVSYKEVEVELGSSTESNLTADNTDRNTAGGETESKSNDIEYSALSGTLNFIATPETIKIKVGQTIELKGLGKYLSGNYYVSSVTRNISSNGYTHSCNVIKTDFGNSLKSDGTSTTSKTDTSVSTDIPKDSSSGALIKVYTVCAGDTPYTIAKKVYGDGKRCDRLFDYKTQTRLDVTSQLAVGQKIQLG